MEINKQENKQAGNFMESNPRAHGKQLSQFLIIFIIRYKILRQKPCSFLAATLLSI